MTKTSMFSKHALTKSNVFSWNDFSIWQQIFKIDWKIHYKANIFRLNVAMKMKMFWRFVLWLFRQRHRCFTNISNFSFRIAISLIQYLYDLIVRNSKNVSMKWKKRKMIEKSTKKIMHRMRDKFLRTYIDAMNANSNFSILIKICQRIKSINMRKDSIFSIFFDRILVLRNRNVMIA